MMWSTTLANLKENLNKIALDVHDDDDDDGGDDYEKLSEISNSRNSSFSDRRNSLNHGRGFPPVANGLDSTSNSEVIAITVVCLIAPLGFLRGYVSA
ncbi:hypothetical protein L2E82_04559 [Cichorium intybus]|uniref:Uncharacterized protein n=1 Tax=Cichorium intybus TaxID=13427 RepID=A0ACB9H5J2_CICIN|nr:hypothetical protein L2E82_04559 [Cichorium intybus]